MPEREHSIKPKTTKVEKREVERKVELNKETKEQIRTFLQDREEKVNDLLRFEKFRGKLSSDEFTNLETNLRSSLREAKKELEESKPLQELLRWLDISGPKETQLKGIADIYSEFITAGIIPENESIKKRRSGLKQEINIISKERKGLVRKLTAEEEKER